MDMNTSTHLGRRISKLVTISLVTAGLVVLSAGGFTRPAAALASDNQGLNGKIAFEKNGDIFTVKSDGSNLVQLTNTGKNHYPVYSPDGSRIAYVRDTAAGGKNIWIMNADGTAKDQVTTDGSVSTGAAWSPDGSQLAFGGLCVPTTGQPNQCQFHETSPVLDTISSSAPYGTPHSITGCWRQAGVSGCPPRFVATDVTGGKVAWSVNDVIAFYSPDFPGATDDYLMTYTFSDHGYRSFDLVNGACCGAGYFANPAFSPDGSLLAYDQYAYFYQDGHEHYGIQMCDAPYHYICDRFIQVRDDSGLVFAPNAKRVVLSNSGMLILANPDGTSRQSLVAGINPSWQATP